MASFQERLLQLRHEADLTRKNVAEYLNISPDKYKMFEEDSRKSISPEIVSQLTNLYNTSADYILGISDDPTRYSHLSEDKRKQIQKIINEGHDETIKYS